MNPLLAPICVCLLMSYSLNCVIEQCLSTVWSILEVYRPAIQDYQGYVASYIENRTILRFDPFFAPFFTFLSFNDDAL